MLHIHFGAGRLGLGLVAPFFQKPGSELFLLNRTQSGKNETGSTELTPERKRELLRNHPERKYGIQTPGTSDGIREVVTYDQFISYDLDTIEELTAGILRQSARKSDGVIVTGSVLKVSNYESVVRTLNIICKAKEAGEQVGDVYLVACENTVSAHEVLEEPTLRDQLCPETRRHLRCVHALVDRMCVALEEYPGGNSPLLHPTVLVRAEEYGSLKLELRRETQRLPELCRGSRIEFSEHLAVEKKIKGWLLNGTHWLIALTAFQATEGDAGLKLNEYLAAHPERGRFAEQVLSEISEGIEIILRNEPEYADFVRDVSPDAYLDGAAKAILRRFAGTEDSITRILARFRKPSPEETTTIESFVKRFFDRVDEPIAAYEAEKGFAPPATSHGLVSLCRLLASGTFVDNAAA